MDENDKKRTNLYSTWYKINRKGCINWEKLMKIGLGRNKYCCG